MKSKKNANNSKFRIFISYRREGGAEKANLVKKELMLHGYTEEDIFLDVHSMHQCDFVQRIPNAIKNSDSFILIVGNHTFDKCKATKDWLRQEIEIAIDNSIPIIPIFFDNITFIDPQNIPVSLHKLCSRNGVSFNAEYSSFFYERLESFLPSYSFPIPKTNKILESKKDSIKHSDYKFSLPNRKWLIGGICLVAGCIIIAILSLHPQEKIPYIRTSLPPLPKDTRGISYGLFSEKPSSRSSVYSPSYKLVDIPFDSFSEEQKSNINYAIKHYQDIFNRTNNKTAIYNIAMLYRKAEGSNGNNYQHWLQKGIDLKEGNCLYINAVKNTSDFYNWHQKGKNERDNITLKLKEASEKGSLEALGTLGQIYYIDGDTLSAEKALRTVCNMAERTQISYEFPMTLSEIYYNTKRYADAYYFAELSSNVLDDWNIGLRFFIPYVANGVGRAKNDKMLYQLVNRLNRSDRNPMPVWEAQLYYEGIGCKTDKQQVINLTETALEKGNNSSITMDMAYIAALIYLYGTDVEKNDKKAFDIIHQICGNQYGCSYIREIKYLLGYMFQYGIGCEADADSAMIYYKQSESSSNGSGIFKPTAHQIALMTLENLSTTNNIKKGKYALELLHYASTTDIKEYMSGGILLKDTLIGIPQSLYNIGVYYYNHSDTVVHQKDSAFSYFIKAAAMGVNEAQLFLKGKD